MIKNTLHRKLGTSIVHLIWRCRPVHVVFGDKRIFFLDRHWACRSIDRWHITSPLWSFVSMWGKSDWFTGDLSTSIPLDQFYIDVPLGLPLFLFHCIGYVCRTSHVSFSCRCLYITSRGGSPHPSEILERIGWHLHLRMNSSHRSRRSISLCWLE